MRQRPLSVTAVALLLLFWGLHGAWRILTILGLVSLSDSKAQTVSTIASPFAILVAGALIDLIAGFNILRGANWARLLWSSWFAFHMILSCVMSWENNIPTILLVTQSVMVLFLFLPKANAFFLGE